MGRSFYDLADFLGGSSFRKPRGRKCPRCGSHYTSAYESLMPSGGTSQKWACQDCGHIWTRRKK